MCVCGDWRWRAGSYLVGAAGYVFPEDYDHGEHAVEVLVGVAVGVVDLAAWEIVILDAMEGRVSRVYEISAKKTYLLGYSLSRRL